MKKKKYTNILLSHYELIKNAPIEFREVLSYALLSYNFEDLKINLPAEASETWEILQQKVDTARINQLNGARGGYYLHKKEATSPKLDATSDVKTPVNTQKLETSPARALVSSNINNNINTNILTTPGTSKKEKSIKVTNKGANNQFIPPALEEVVKFFTDNGYTTNAATICYNYYVDGDWTDSQGRPVQNWRRKVRFNWFKPEYLEVKGSVYTRTQYRPA